MITQVIIQFGEVNDTYTDAVTIDQDGDMTFETRDGDAEASGVPLLEQEEVEFALSIAKQVQDYNGD